MRRDTYKGNFHRALGRSSGGLFSSFKYMPDDRQPAPKEKFAVPWRDTHAKGKLLNPEVLPLAPNGKPLGEKIPVKRDTYVPKLAGASVSACCAQIPLIAD